MAVLHIEHQISDFGVWKGAFDGFAGKRHASGVVGERVARPVDDPQYVLIDLDFEMVEQAYAFLDFLRRNVWSTPTNAPALVGPATARVLELEHQTSATG